MDTREIASEYRFSHWTQIMQERSASGLSIRKYCKTAGIAECVYYYWQRKLREVACKELLPAADGESEKALVPSGCSLLLSTLFNSLNNFLARNQFC